MNQGASKACRADRRLAGRGGKVPREMKRAWETLTHKERGKIRKHWRMTQKALAAFGDQKHKAHLDRLQASQRSAPDAPATTWPWGEGERK